MIIMIMGFLSFFRCCRGGHCAKGVCVSEKGWEKVLKILSFVLCLANVNLLRHFIDFNNYKFLPLNRRFHICEYIFIPKKKLSSQFDFENS